MEIDQRGHQKNHFPLLVVDKNKDHQLIISYCLRAKFPQAEPMLASSAKEAIAFLRLSFAHKKTFPRLLLLDPLLPSLREGFALLAELRTTYPQLPVIIFSSQQDQHLVYESYQQGAHSFISKPTSLEIWEQYVQCLKEYWLDVVSLPNEF